MDKELFNKKFAENLKAALDYLGIPERDRVSRLRAAIKKALGTKPADQSVRQWVEGKNTPTNFNLVALCDQLGLSVAYLLTGRGPILSGSEAVDIHGNSVKITVSQVPLLSEREVKDFVLYKRNVDLSNCQTATITHHSGPDTFALAMPDNSMFPLMQKGVVVAIDPDYPGLDDLVNCDKPVAVLDNGAVLIGRYRNGMLMFENERFEPHRLSDEAKVFGCVIRITETII